VLAGLPVAAVSCNQTLGIMLTRQLCAPLWQDRKDMVLPLENGIVLLAASQGASPVPSWAWGRNACPMLFICIWCH